MLKPLTAVFVKTCFHSASLRRGNSDISGIGNNTL